MTESAQPPLQRRTTPWLTLAALASAMAALPLGCGSTSREPLSQCAVCNIEAFACLAFTPTTAATGQARITSVSETACSGTLDFADEVALLWLDCDTGTVCVEHSDECFDAMINAQDFSYTVASKNTTVTCTAK